MRIERERYVICKRSRHGAMILCTVNNKSKWCYILHLDAENVRSYSSEAKARQAYTRQYGVWNPNRVKAVRVIETYQNVLANSRLLKDLRKRVEEEDNLYDDIPGFIEPVGQYDPTGVYEQGESPEKFEYGSEDDAEEAFLDSISGQQEDDSEFDTDELSDEDDE